MSYAKKTSAKATVGEAAALARTAVRPAEQSARLAFWVSLVAGLLSMVAVVRSCR